MENKKISAGYVVTLAVLILVSFLALTGINSFTAPLIESNSVGEQFDLLYSVMPDATGFEQLYGGADTELTDVPETVQGIFTEKSGAGYVILLSTTQGYTGEPIEFTLAVDGEGKISGVEMTNYPETRDFRETDANYLTSYIGQDSTLADVGLVASVTYSSSAFRGAVTDGLEALIANGLIAAGVKDDAQVLEEMLPQVYSGIANRSGIVQAEEQEIANGQYTYIQRSLKALNEAGYAYYVTDGTNNYLAICNVAGGVKVYDVQGNDVTDDPALADLVAEVTADAAANLEVSEKIPRKLSKMFPDDAEATPIALDDVFSSVTEAYEVDAGGETLYGFVAHPYGYSNMPMDIYFLLDANGAIVSMNSGDLIFFEEYFSDYELEEASYKDGFAGLTSDSWTEEQALISGATFSTEGVSVATEDVFEAFEILVNGGQANE